MKKIINLLIITLAVIIGLIVTNCEIKNENKSSQKTLSKAENKANLDKRRKWEASPEGIKVHASHDKIKKSLKAFSNMEATVTSVTFERTNATSGPKWLIVKINDYEYMMQYIPKDFEPLKNLKVNEKIIVRSRSAGYSHNHPYLILSGDYIEQNNKALFKRDFSKNKGC